MSAPGLGNAPVGPAWRLIVTLAGLGLLFLGIVVLLLSSLKLLGFAMVAAGLVVRMVSVILSSIDRWQARLSSPLVWWYAPKTHQVASGRFAPGFGWDGPYASEDEAARAPEIARSRAAEWNAED